MPTGQTLSVAPVTDPRNASLAYLYLVRGVVAIVWAGALAAGSSHLDATASTLLIAYPAIDVLASLYDARKNPGVNRIQLVNAVISAVALVAVAVATTYDTRAVLHVFGVWASVTGVVQLVVALRRRSRYGWQWAMLISGGLSTLAGIAFTVMAEGDDPKFSTLAGYAALGGVLFVVSALLLKIRASRGVTATPR